MNFDRDKYTNCTYVIGLVSTHSASPLDPPHGFVEVGGDPDMVSYSRRIATIQAEKRRGLLKGYTISECDRSFYSSVKKHEIGRAFTLFGARRKVEKRVDELTQIASQQLELPIVDFEEAQRHIHKADDIYCERMKAEWSRK